MIRLGVAGVCRTQDRSSCRGLSASLSSTSVLVVEALASDVDNVPHSELSVAAVHTDHRLFVASRPAAPQRFRACCSTSGHEQELAAEELPFRLHRPQPPLH